MWEYKREKYLIDTLNELDKILINEGLNNWEIVYYNEKKPEKFGNKMEIIIVFKRLKNEQKKSSDNS